MKRQILIYGDSRTNSDMLYFSGISVPDAFFAFTLGGKKCALMSPLELGRASKRSSLDEIFDFAEVSKKLNHPRPDYAHALVFILRRARVRGLIVPKNFPAFALDFLRGSGFDVKVAEAEIFPERAVKSSREVGEIARANDVACAGFAIAEEILRQSRIDGNFLIYRGAKLTSEFLRSEIERAAIALGADSFETIVASGNQACDPHETGMGAIAPHSLVVMDIFPRLRSSGYHGDMTRTFLKGYPSDAQARLVDSVLRAQAVGFSKLRAGVAGCEIHAAVEESFKKDGFRTGAGKGGWFGFFHSTGHGIGLDVHEAPSLGRSAEPLKDGNVVTVEPGLYYRGLGGCRIEDNAVVRPRGYKMLSNYHYEWVIS